MTTADAMMLNELLAVAPLAEPNAESDENLNKVHRPGPYSAGVT
jgi:hypothetical protein